MLPELGGPQSARRRPPGLLGRIIAAVVTLAAMVVGLMFSLVVFAIALAFGIVIFGWLWWKVRRALRQARQDPRFQAYQSPPGAASAAPKGDVIEGEVIRGEWQDGGDKRR
ncbi:MAG: YjgN family protein [Pseudomonadota bacterium]|nr:YjgN family protein [Pseudomonadota bacterium]